MDQDLGSPSRLFSGRSRVILCGLGVFILGLFLGYFSHDRTKVNIELELFKERVRVSGLLRTLPEVITDHYGVVREVGGDRIVIDQVRPMDPFADPALDTRTVMIGKDTHVVRLVQYAPSSQDVGANGAAVSEQLILERIPANASDLKFGQSIRVVTQENAKGAPILQARTIEFAETRERPEGAPAGTGTPR